MHNTNYSELRSSAKRKAEYDHPYKPRIPRFLNWLKEQGVPLTVADMIERSGVPTDDIVRLVAICHGNNLLRIRCTSYGTYYSPI